MNDPFASLDPIQKPKTAAERVLTAPVYNQPPAAPVGVAPFGAGVQGSHHMHMGMGMGMGMAPGAPSGMGPSPMGMMNMNGMGGGGMNPGMNGMNGMNGMAPGGMNPSMGMGMGQPSHSPFQQHPHQQQPQQEPVMYDNIKNLLQQKPKAPAAFEDTASMDFLENLGGGGGSGGAKTNSGSGASFLNPQVRAAEPTSMTVVTDPFGGGFSSSPTSPSTGSGDIGLSIFETGGSSSTPVSPASSAGGAKSSALAARLANGRRTTQEMQRSQLQLNATSFAHPGGAAGPKISLKEMVGQAPTKSAPSTEMSLEEFSSGRSVAASGGDFGGAGDDPFGMTFGSTTSSVAARTGSTSAVRQSSFGGASSTTESEPRPVDDHDSTLW